MIYLTGAVSRKGFWGDFTRLYAWALQQTGLPIWARWTDTKPAQPETIDPSFSSVFELGSVMGSDGELREILPAHAVIRIGPVIEILAHHMKDPGPYNVAITAWHTDKMPKRLVRRLNQFDEVWVSSALQANALLSSGVQHVSVITPPLAPLGVHTVNGEEETSEYLFYAFGQWEGWDDCKAVLDTYLSTFTCDDKVRLLLMCPDSPIRTREDLIEYNDGRESAARVSVVHRLPAKWEEMLEVHAIGDMYASMTHYIGGTLHDSLADAMGSRIYSCMATEEIPPESAQAPYTAPQCWRAPSQKDLTVVMQRAYEAGACAKRLRVGSGSVLLMQELMSDWDESLAPEAPKVVAANPNAKHPPSLAVVIPYKNGGNLEPTLESLVPQLTMMDEVIVSDQGSEDACFERVQELCAKYGATLVSDDAYTGKWSIARARNVGLRSAMDSAEWVMCMDADIILPQGFMDAVKTEAMENPEQGIAPRVAELSEEKSAELVEKGVLGGIEPVSDVLLEGQRIGAGVAALPVSVVEDARGWDETFVGYGSEDIDLFIRLRESTGFEVAEWKDGLCLYHQPHDAQHAHGSENLKRVTRRMEGEITGGVNVDGWGEGGVMVLRRGAE